MHLEQATRSESVRRFVEVDSSIHHAKPWLKPPTTATFFLPKRLNVFYEQTLESRVTIECVQVIGPQLNRRGEPLEGNDTLLEFVHAETRGEVLGWDSLPAGVLEHLAKQTTELSDEQWRVAVMPAKAPEWTPIEDLKLTKRATTILIRGGISTLDELLALAEQDLWELRNCGSNAIAEITAELRRRGLALQEKPYGRSWLQSVADKLHAAGLSANSKPTNAQLREVWEIVAVRL